MSWLHIINVLLQALTGVVTYLFVARAVGRPKPKAALASAEQPKSSAAAAMKRLENSAPKLPGSEEEEERERLTLASWAIICIAVISLGITLRIGKVDAEAAAESDRVFEDRHKTIIEKLDQLIHGFAAAVRRLGLTINVQTAGDATTITINRNPAIPNKVEPRPVPVGGVGDPGAIGIPDGVAGGAGVGRFEAMPAPSTPSGRTGPGDSGEGGDVKNASPGDPVLPVKNSPTPKLMYDYNVLSAMAFPKNDKIELVGDSILQWHVGDDLIVELKPDHPEWFYWTQAKADPALPNKKIFKLSVKADIPNGPRPKPGTAYDVFSTSSGRPFLLRYSDSKSERLATRYHVYYPENHGELVLVEIAPENPGQR